MINHVRTLLLNQSGDTGVSPATPGEEYVPPTYRRRRRPRYLEAALSVLFGGSPDRLYLNYRMRQLMQVLHATELRTHVLARDPRITYELIDSAFFNQVFRLDYAQYAGPPGTLFGSGTHDADMVGGKSTQSWLVELGDTVATVKRLTPPATTTTFPLNIEGGLTAQIPLAGTGLQVRFQHPVAGQAWTIDSRARPGGDIGLLLSQTAQVLGEAGVAALFAGDGEPMQTYRNLWHGQDVFAYRYGALLLAAADVTEQQPQE